MKYWVITNGEDDNFEFHQVESKSMGDAIKQVEGGITVVSPYFKKNYFKYSKLWNNQSDILIYKKDSQIQMRITDWR